MAKEDLDLFKYEQGNRTPRARAYTNPQSSDTGFFNPAGIILAGIEGAETAISNRRSEVKEIENAAIIRRQDMIDSVMDTDSMQDITAIDSIQKELMQKAEELYLLDIKTSEGDRSEFLKKQKDLQRIIGVIPAVMGLIDAEGTTLKENEDSGNLDKLMLRSNDKDYVDFVRAASKGGKGISFKINGGNLVAQLNGRDLFNAGNYVKAKEKGFDLVNFAGNYDKQLGESDKKAYNGLDKLVTKSIIQSVKNGTKLNETQSKNYTKAKAEYEKRLRSGDIALPVNESTYQMFTGYGLNSDAYNGTPAQVQETKEALIKYMIEQRFPTDVEVMQFKSSPLDKKGDGGGSGSDNNDGIPQNYVLDLNKKIATAALANTVNTNALKTIVQEELAGTKINVDDVVLDGNNLVIKNSGTEEEMIFTKEQADAINNYVMENAMPDQKAVIIGDDGRIVSKDGFEFFSTDPKAKEAGVSFVPSKVVRKAGKDITIKNINTTSGIKQLENVLVRNRFSDATSKNPALSTVDALQQGNQNYADAIREQQRLKAEADKKYKQEQAMIPGLKSSRVSMTKGMDPDERKTMLNGFMKTPEYIEYQKRARSKGSFNKSTPSAREYEFTYEKAFTNYISDYFKMKDLLPGQQVTLSDGRIVTKGAPEETTED